MQSGDAAASVELGRADQGVRVMGKEGGDGIGSLNLVSETKMVIEVAEESLDVD
jgi:hypothetical protein